MPRPAHARPIATTPIQATRQGAEPASSHRGRSRHEPSSHEVVVLRQRRAWKPKRERSYLVIEPQSHTGEAFSLGVEVPAAKVEAFCLIREPLGLIREPLSLMREPPSLIREPLSVMGEPFRLIAQALGDTSRSSCPSEFRAVVGGRSCPDNSFRPRSFRGAAYKRPVVRCMATLHRYEGQAALQPLATPGTGVAKRTCRRPHGLDRKGAGFRRWNMCRSDWGLPTTSRLQ